MSGSAISPASSRQKAQHVQGSSSALRFPQPTILSCPFPLAIFHPLLSIHPIAPVQIHQQFHTWVIGRCAAGQRELTSTLCLRPHGGSWCQPVPCSSLAWHTVPLQSLSRMYVALQLTFHTCPRFLVFVPLCLCTLGSLCPGMTSPSISLFLLRSHNHNPGFSLDVTPFLQEVLNYFRLGYVISSMLLQTLLLT